MRSKFLQIFILSGLLLILLLYSGFYFRTFWQIQKKAFLSRLSGAEAELSYLRRENYELKEALFSEQDKNRLFEKEIGRIFSVVGGLQKLSELDPELLKKYSKVYFLSENYVPKELTTIDPEYLYTKSQDLYFHKRALLFLEKMFAAAEADGIKLMVVSAYRSFGQQADIKSGLKITYGYGANRFSADQGYSEHQLGTTVDLTSQETGAFNKFEATAGYKWLNANAYNFGFVLSYPPGNSYYVFEPWHWRFVGTALATKLREQGKYFYDLPQREIDEYLITIFD